MGNDIWKVKMDHKNKTQNVKPKMMTDHGDHEIIIWKIIIWKNWFILALLNFDIEPHISYLFIYMPAFSFYIK